MRPSLRSLALGLGAAGLLVVSSVVEAVTTRDVAPESVGSTIGVTLALIAVGVFLAPFSAVAGLVTACVAYPLQILIDNPRQGIGGTLLIAMMILVGQGAARLRTVPSAVGAAGAALLGSGYLVTGGESAFEFLFFGVTMGGAWAVGWLLRRERLRSRELRTLAAALTAERERSGRLAVVDERARISRELHDAVAHTVSVMTLQVGVVRRRLEDTTEGQVLRSVEELGRRSVDELRRVVGMLRADGGEVEDREPTPSLRRLDTLVAELARVGLAVTVRVEGDAVDLAPAMDTSAYRIVAEALTNVLRHADVGAAEVVLGYRGDTMEIEILDRGHGPGPSDSDGSGHGLLHMHERATLFGGVLTAGARKDGGFRVHATLPLGPRPVATGTGSP